MTEREALRSRIDRGEAVYGLIVKMPNQPVVEMAGYAGFDLVMIDTEHGLADDSALENHLRSATLAGISALVRLGRNDPVSILRVLDAGAAGVIVPHISTAGEAADAVRAAHYPPLGSRGLAISTIAGRYGAVTLNEHLEDAQRNTIVLAQAEDKDAAANIRSIVAVPDLTGVWIGPTDLSMSLGHPGQSDHPVVAAAIENIAQATTAAGRALCVIADSAEDAERWVERGARIILFNSTSLIGGVFRSVLSRAKASTDD
jgi:4-hydroxy-2-oxoheptanedioate aldolase